MQNVVYLKPQIEAIATTVHTAIGMPEAVWKPAAWSAARPLCDGLAGYIDHTLLKPDTTPPQVEQLCAEARQHGFASVCIYPAFVAQAAGLLRDTPVRVCAVVDFPGGTGSTPARVNEARQAVGSGASEIDVVLPLASLKAGDYRAVYDDLSTLANECCRQDAILKVIIETAKLTAEEKIAACLLVSRAQATFVKTSTGFAEHGATTQDVALLRYVVGPTMGVKASGGIRDRSTACAMIAAGATRIGASASVEIVKGA